MGTRGLAQVLARAGQGSLRSPPWHQVRKVCLPVFSICKPQNRQSLRNWFPVASFPLHVQNEKGKVLPMSRFSHMSPQTEVQTSAWQDTFSSSPTPLQPIMANLHKWNLSFKKKN